MRACILTNKNNKENKNTRTIEIFQNKLDRNLITVLVTILSRYTFTAFPYRFWTNSCY